jgi:hypothetical protein
MGVLPTACFLLSAVLGLAVYGCVLRFLYEVSEVKALTTAQYGVAVAYGVVIALWAGAEAGFAAAKMQPRYDSIAEDEQDLVNDGDKSEAEEARETPKSAVAPSASVCGISHSKLTVLRFGAEFVAIMGFIYLCDRTSLVAKGPKYVNPYAFWGVNAAILLLALFTMRTEPASEVMDAHVKPMQRDQTEEWKGWMQIMFVLYHYFAEAEIYNAIRMYIAAYVWMTGFGNFSYYYVKKDFTAVRFAQMMCAVALACTAYATPTCGRSAACRRQTRSPQAPRAAGATRRAAGARAARCGC